LALDLKLIFPYVNLTWVINLRIVVTGGAGFIGSHLVDELIKEGHEIIVVDNLSSGSLNNIKHHMDNPDFKLVKDDLKNFGSNWVKEFKDCDAVFHLAANPEVRVSVTEPRIHFNENILATFNVLEACRLNNVRYLVFASSSTIYGDAEKLPTPEDYAPLEPISVYGAAKLSCEYLAITYSRLYGIRTLILRYANIIGPRLNHGVIYDFINKLRRNPHQLEILGDGTQRKSYLYISDAISATYFLFDYLVKGAVSDYEVFNVGNDDWITVNEIAKIVVNEMGLKNVEFVYKPATPDGRGWKGDVKFMLLDISKLKSLGWSPKLTSYEAVRRTTRDLLKEILNK